MYRALLLASQVTMLLSSSQEKSLREQNRTVQFEGTSNYHPVQPPDRFKADLPSLSPCQSTVKNQWAGFVCVEISGAMSLYKREKCSC